MFTNEFIASNDFLKTYQWRRLRQKVIRNNQKRCSCCGIAPDNNNSIYLCVDHILPRKTHPELALSIDNLQVLCNECSNHGKGLPLRPRNAKMDALVKQVSRSEAYSFDNVCNTVGAAIALLN